MSSETRILLVLGVAIGLWFPLAQVDWWKSHEMVAYGIRTVEWAVELRSGALYPRWCPDFYGGYGSPFFIFHGPVVYGFAGLLHALGVGAFPALKLVMLLASILAGLGSYALILGETRDRDAALLGAVAYMASPYRLGDLTERGDLAEFACIALLPVVIALYRAAAREALPRRAQWLAVAASVGHAILIMTHPVLGLWGSIVIGFIVLVSVARFVARREARRAGLLVLALACAPALAAVYVVPAVVYREMVQTTAMVASQYSAQENWVRLGTLFADSVYEFDRNFLRIGPIALVASLATVLGLVRNPRRAWTALGWLGFAAVLNLLVLPQSRAFWTSPYVPFARFIQFPWRLLGPVALLSSVALGIGVAVAGERLSVRVRSRIALIGSGLLLFMVAWPYAWVKEIPTDQVPLDAENIRQWLQSTTSANEFLPRQATRIPAEVPNNVVINMDGATVQDTSRLGSHHLLTLRADRPGASAGLALHGFPGWTVETASAPTGALAQLQTDEQGLLRLLLPAPGVYQVRLWFGMPRAATLGLCLSMLSVLVLGLVLVQGARPWPWRMPTKMSEGGVR